MKNKFLHITLSYFLLSNLLLGQVVVNFFHDHKEHPAYSITKEGSVLSEHEDVCKVCSLNIIHELYYNEAAIAVENFTYHIICSAEAENLKYTYFYLKTGRAPPIPVFQS